MKLPRTFVPFLFFLSLITAKKIINCNVLIIYHSVTNHTKKLAHAIGNGVTNHNNIKGIDLGCVWGGSLAAINIEDKSIITVDSVK